VAVRNIEEDAGIVHVFAARCRAALLAAALSSLVVGACQSGTGASPGTPLSSAARATPLALSTVQAAPAPPLVGATPNTTSDPTLQPTSSPAVASPTGYSQLSVPIAAGSFTVDLIKERLIDVHVRTVTATLTECFSECAAKPLAQYVAENGAYAGIHGSYFCPPDYALCASKINTYDYAVYNSALGAWLNPRHLVNPRNALAVWNGSTPTFYRRVSTFRASPITAGISNFPLLLQGGVVADMSRLDASQLVRASRGAIAVDSTFLYLAIVAGATVPETAGVLQALGALDAMNLDGGSSDAMWISGRYVVGPGRQLPNAILLVKP